MDRLSALKGRFEQILVISHIEEINQVADQCLYLSRDPQTRSTIVSDAPPMDFADL
jgi:DNA repair exonuclease SbcCD ATPase subunit